jgi:hypothetical protein
LFAAGKGAGELFAALQQTRKQRIRACDIAPYRLAISAQIGAHIEVFSHRQTPENATSLRHQRHAARDDGMCRQFMQALAGKMHVAMRLDQPHQAFQRAAFASAIGADQADQFTLIDMEINSAHGLDAAVSHLQPANLEQAHAGVPPR